MKKKLISLLMVLVIIFNALSTSLISIASSSVIMPNPSLVVSVQDYLDDGMIDIVIGITGNYKAYGVTYQFKYDTSKLTPAYYKLQGKTGSWVEATSISDWAPITNDWSYYYSDNNSHWNRSTGAVYLQTQSGTGINAHNEIGNGSYTYLENKYDGFVPVAICSFLVSDDFSEEDLTTNLISLIPNAIYPTGFEIIYEDNGNRSLENTSYIAYDGLSIGTQQPETPGESGGESEEEPEEDEPTDVVLPNPALVVSAQDYTEDGMLDVVIGLAGDYKAYGVTYYFKYDTSKLTPAYYKMSGKDGEWVEATTMSDWAPIDSNWSCSYSENNTYWNLDSGEVYLQTQSGTGFNAYDEKGNSGYSELEEKYNGFFPVATCSFFVADGFSSEDISTSLISLIPTSTYPKGFDIVYENNGNQNLDDTSYIKYDGFTKSSSGDVEEPTEGVVPNPALVVAAQDYTEDGMLDLVIGLTGDYKAYGVTYYFKYDTSKLTPACYKMSGKEGQWVEATTMSEWAPIDSNWSCSYSDHNTYWNLDSGEVYLQTQSGTGFNAHDQIGNTGYSELEEKYDGFFPVAVCSFFVADEFNSEDISTSLISLVSTSTYPNGFDIVYEDNGNKNLNDTSYIKYDGFVKSSSGDVEDPSEGVVQKPALVVAAQDYTEDGMLDVVVGITGNYTAYGVTYYFKYDTSKLTPAYYKLSGRTGSWVEATTMSEWAPIDSNWSYSYSTNNTYWNLDSGEVYLQTQSGTGINAYDEIGNTAYSALEQKYNGFFPVAVCSFFVEDGFTSADITRDLISELATDIYPNGFDIVYEDNGNQNLDNLEYITYDGFGESTEVNVSNVKIKQNPDKLEYNHSDAIDLTGGILEITKEDGTVEEVSMSKATLLTAIADVSSDTVSIKYKDVILTYNITVNDPVKTLEFVTAPSKAIYKQDEVIDLTNGVLKATTNSGVQTIINLPNENVSINSDTADLNHENATITNIAETGEISGIQEIIATYEGKTASYTILINDTIESIEVREVVKQEYKYKEELDLTNENIIAHTTSGGEVSIPMTDGNVAVSGYNNSKLGTQELTVEFIGKTTTFNVTVRDYVVKISVKSPDKTEYNYGEELNLEGGSITEIMATGAAGSTIPLTDSSISISNYNSSDAVAQEVLVTYTNEDGEFTGEFGVVVNDEIDSIQIQTLPTKVIYRQGEELDLTGGTLLVQYKSGNVIKDISLLDDSVTVTGYDSTILGKQILFVEYQGFKQNMTVMVVAQPTKIAGNVITENAKEVHEATVTIYNAEDNSVVAECQTNTDGSFEIVMYDPVESSYADANSDGIADVLQKNYKIEISKPGYLSHNVADVTLNVGKTVTITDCALIAGDVNGDGAIELSDLVMMNDNYGKTGEENADILDVFDFNGDGVVDALDREILKTNYGK